MIHRLVRLAQELDENGQPRLADQIDDVVEWVGRQYLSGKNMRDIASEIGMSPLWAQAPLRRFWARHPDLESAHAVRGLSTNWELARRINEAAELGFTFQQIDELLGLDMSPDMISSYCTMFRERFPNESTLGPPPPIPLARMSFRPPEEVERLADEIGRMKTDEALTFDQIAARLGMTKSNVASMFYQKFVPKNPQHAPRRNDDASNIASRMLEMYERGVTKPEISSTFGYARSFNSTEFMMRHLPIEMLPRLIRIRMKNSPDEMASTIEKIKRMTEMRLEPRPMKEISRELGLSPAYMTIYSRMAISMDPSLADRFKDAENILKKRPTGK